MNNTGRLARETDPPSNIDTNCRYCNSTRRTLLAASSTLRLWECADCARPWYRTTPVEPQ